MGTKRPFNLYNEMIDLYNRSPMTGTELCRRAKVSRRWLTRVLSGSIADPSVHRIQELYDILFSEAEKLTKKSPSRERA